MRVLVVDDDGEMTQVVAVGLRRAQMAVDLAFDGTEALVGTCLPAIMNDL
jgi:DNA-binding response OmpR family regulator